MSLMYSSLLTTGGQSISPLKCVRNVANVGSRAHSEPLFSKLKTLTFTDLFKMNACNFIHNLSKINSNYNSNSLHHGLTMKTEKFSIFTVKSALQEREHPQACTVVGGGEIGYTM